MVKHGRRLSPVDRTRRFVWLAQLFSEPLFPLHGTVQFHPQPFVLVAHLGVLVHFASIAIIDSILSWVFLLALPIGNDSRKSFAVGTS